ncbi:MAG TPA: peptidoglycan editing factor PgeF [Rhodanobacter sp.]|nr:peptidoglycan editing factor PgeF [Rhodanobacter sp.]
MTEPWLFPDWPVPPQVHAAVTTRSSPGQSQAAYARCNLGLHSGEDVAIVEANRSAVQAALQLPAAPQWLRQVHGSGVVHCGQPAPSDEPQADAAVTATPGTVLAILTADCLPVLFCTRDGQAVAAAHAGWRGLAAGVLEATLAGMPAPAAQVLAWLGPCIGAGSYEVGAEVREAFVARDPAAEACFMATRPGHWLCDLAALARQRLQAAGVQAVYGGGFDTYGDPRWYSYRRDGKHSGRFASLIWRV